MVIPVEDGGSAYRHDSGDLRVSEAGGQDSGPRLYLFSTAIEQIPAKEHATEARPLQEKLQASPNDRKRGPQLLRDILPIILARLGVGSAQSPESGEAGLT